MKNLTISMEADKKDIKGASFKIDVGIILSEDI